MMFLCNNIFHKTDLDEKCDSWRTIHFYPRKKKSLSALSFKLTHLTQTTNENGVFYN